MLFVVDISRCRTLCVIVTATANIDMIALQAWYHHHHHHHQW